MKNFILLFIVVVGSMAGGFFGARLAIYLDTKKHTRTASDFIKILEAAAKAEPRRPE